MTSTILQLSGGISSRVATTYLVITKSKTEPPRRKARKVFDKFFFALFVVFAVQILYNARAFSRMICRRKSDATVVGIA